MTSRAEKAAERQDKLEHARYVDWLITAKDDEALAELPEDYEIIGPIPRVTWSPTGIPVGGEVKLWILERLERKRSGAVIVESIAIGRIHALVYAAQLDAGIRKKMIEPGEP